MDGLQHIAQAFEQARREGRAALMPYYTLGYPDLARSLEVVRAIASAGADLIELGIPFSDPLADGPTIQRSTHAALAAGTTVQRCLEQVRALRSAEVTQPLLLMGYLNPVLAYGVERYVADAVSAGADGFIVPDLPPEEAGLLEVACRARGCALVDLLAPNATAERAALVAAHSTGFLYLVSVTGVTGARATLDHDIAHFVSRVRPHTRLPLAVGFGVSTPAQAAAIGKVADGVIVGSALINAVDRAADRAAEPAAGAAGFIHGLRSALKPERE